MNVIKFPVPKNSTPYTGKEFLKYLVINRLSRSRFVPRAIQMVCIREMGNMDGQHNFPTERQGVSIPVYEE